MTQQLQKSSNLKYHCESNVRFGFRYPKQVFANHSMLYVVGGRANKKCTAWKDLQKLRLLIDYQVGYNDSCRVQYPQRLSVINCTVMIWKKVRTKGFNWSEAHLYRSNFLQNPYFKPRYDNKLIMNYEFSTRKLQAQYMLCTSNCFFVFVLALRTIFGHNMY